MHDYGIRESKEPEGRERLALALTSLPGLVGLALGVIYALGAIQTFAQLWDRNDLLYLFSLVPLTQILSKGIALAIAYGLILVLTAFLAAFFNFTSNKRGRLSKLLQRRLEATDNASSRRPAILALLASLVLLILFLSFSYSYLS